MFMVSTLMEIAVENVKFVAHETMYERLQGLKLVRPGKRKVLCHRALVLQVNVRVDSKDWIDSMDSTDSISEILIQSNKTVTRLTPNKNNSLIRKFRLPTMIKTTTQIYVNNTSIHIETYIHPPLTHILQY